MRPPRVLVLSSLFPSIAQGRHGIFVETRLRHLMADCNVDARVIAPVPWFPSRNDMFGDYAKWAATPYTAERDYGLKIWHPRYFMLPYFGFVFQPDSLARAILATVPELTKDGWAPDLIDAHYFYPDGVAAAIVSRELKIPCVVTARGTDINVMGAQHLPSRRIVAAAHHASAVIAVSTRLKETMCAMGVDESKVTVLRNGVDLNVFRIENTDESRTLLGLPQGVKLAACVGNLKPEKGQALAIQALKFLPDLHLAIVGSGPTRSALVALTRKLEVENRVTFIPNMLQKDLRFLYSSIDVLLLPSTREGWPNVILESLACGAPVVAADVGAVREMLTTAKVGRVAPEREPAVFAASIKNMLESPGTRAEIRNHASRFDWGTISRGQLEIFNRMLNRSPATESMALAKSPSN